MAKLLIVYHSFYKKFAKRLTKHRKKQGHKVLTVKFRRRRVNIRKIIRRKNISHAVLIGNIDEIPSIMLDINETWAKTTLNQNVKKAASDISYGVINGELKCVVGRLSSGDNKYGGNGRELSRKNKRRNIANQVTKIFISERANVDTRGKRVAGIGSSEGNGYGIDGMSDKEFLHSELERMYQEDGVIYNEFFDGSGVGSSEGIADGVVLDSAGNPSDNSLLSLMNSEDGLRGLFYTGHANEVGLSTSGFDVGDLSGLVKRKDAKNLFIGCAVGCSVGSHDENYMSLSEGLQCCKLSGSIAFFGSTILQSWAPPMYMQRAIMRGFGDAKTVGDLFRLGVEVENFRTATDFWFYTLFGDPLTKMN